MVLNQILKDCVGKDIKHKMRDTTLLSDAESRGLSRIGINNVVQLKRQAGDHIIQLATSPIFL